MRLPHLTNAARIHAGENNAAELDWPGDVRSLVAHRDGVAPQGCCGVKICVPLVGCHCAGVESPLCP